MTLSTLDWTIVSVYFLFVLCVGIYVSRRAGGNVTDFFLSGRNMPWWLLGVSMVATTFSSDTPNLVTGLVRESGVSGNWGWWAFLLTGMLTVFVYAKLWRRSGVLTDVEFYELRYSGKPAAFLRGFRALYLGLVFNVLVMGTVSLAAIKFGEIVLGLPGWQTLLIAGTITLVYSTLGGLKAVIITDFVQFVLAMIGSIWACIYILGLDEIGGVSGLLADERVMNKMSILPDFSDPGVWIPVLLVPLAVQWWASYYPGAEPGGGGYIAQRMFSAKDEKNAVGATLLYNTAHIALRPWPWILIALASLIIFPDLDTIQSVFPSLSESKVGNDVAYPAMLTLLPSGLLGLVAASLIAAFMSTMSTQLNLGASYLVNDVYQRFVNPNATQSQLVNAGRLFTLISAVLGLGLGLLLTDATQAFNLLLLIGAGTGLIYIMRWFWWRINATTEIVAMIASMVIAGSFTFLPHGLDAHWALVSGVMLTTLTWIAATYLTPPTDMATLRGFYQKIRPGGPGWNHVILESQKEGITIDPPKTQIALELLCFVIGTITVYSALFATGNFIYGETGYGFGLMAIAGLGTYFLFRSWSKISGE
ncbi:MAG: sodium:solute symporter family protein [Bacteroidota bacterium]